MFYSIVLGSFFVSTIGHKVFFSNVEKETILLWRAESESTKYSFKMMMAVYDVQYSDDPIERKKYVRTNKHKHNRSYHINFYRSN